MLNPAEALAFGGLWLAVVSLYDATWPGMSLYLVSNVAFGAVGHLGVEPAPRSFGRWPVLRWLGTSTFHAQHHGELRHNFEQRDVFAKVDAILRDHQFRTSSSFPAMPSGPAELMS